MGEGFHFDPEGPAEHPARHSERHRRIPPWRLPGAWRDQLQKNSQENDAGGTALLFCHTCGPQIPGQQKIVDQLHVLLTVGLDLLIVLLSYIPPTWRKPQVSYQFQFIFGMNALFIYLLSEYLLSFLYFIRVDEGTLFRHTCLSPFIGCTLYLGFAAAGFWLLAFTMVCWAAGCGSNSHEIYSLASCTRLLLQQL